MIINDCDCVVLCGGLGKRLRSIVDDVPKVMAQVDGRPFLDFIIDNLKIQNIRRIILCVGYKAESIEQYYRGRDFGLTIDFSTESEPLGTGGAIKNAREMIGSNPFFVLNGDSFLPADLQTFLNYHIDKKSLVSMCVSQVTDRGDFGSLILDENDQVVNFKEKVSNSQASFVNAGVYCFSQDIFSFMPDGNHFSLENDLFSNLDRNQFHGYRIKEEFMDIGTPERYASVKKKLKKGK